MQRLSEREPTVEYAYGCRQPGVVAKDASTKAITSAYFEGGSDADARAEYDALVVEGWAPMTSQDVEDCAGVKPPLTQTA